MIITAVVHTDMHAYADFVSRAASVLISWLAFGGMTPQPSHVDAGKRSRLCCVHGLTARSDTIDYNNINVYQCMQLCGCVTLYMCAAGQGTVLLPKLQELSLSLTRLSRGTKPIEELNFRWAV